jgi:hypothetical protein
MPTAGIVRPFFRNIVAVSVNCMSNYFRSRVVDYRSIQAEAANDSGLRSRDAIGCMRHVHTIPILSVKLRASLVRPQNVTATEEVFLDK